MKLSSEDCRKIEEFFGDRLREFLESLDSPESFVSFAVSLVGIPVSEPSSARLGNTYVIPIGEEE